MKKILLFLTFLGTLGANAQTNTANGTVTDCNGDPVAGLAVHIFGDSIGGVAYFNTVYTDSAGFYEDHNIPYNTFLGGVQGFSITIWYGGSGYFEAESPSSAGNIYTYNFSVVCDTTTSPASDSIYGYSLISGHVYDCLGNPMAGHGVYIEMDSTGTGHYYSTLVYTDPTGFYHNLFPRMDPNGTPVTMNVYSYNPFWSLGIETGTGTSMVIGDSIVADLNMDCPTCSVDFYAYWDSTGTSGNDTIYLYVNYASLNPMSTTVTWDYGDGTVGSGVNTIHEYTSSGMYNVCVTVNNPADSCTATHCDSILFVSRASTRIIKTMPAPAMGIKDPSNTEHVFTIYPNPANQVLNISSGAMVRSVRMFDMSGREVISKEQSAASGQLSLDIDHIDSGMYILQLFNENNELLHTHNVLKH